MQARNAGQGDCPIARDGVHAGLDPRDEPRLMVDGHALAQPSGSSAWPKWSTGIALVSSLKFRWTLARALHYV